MNRRKSLGVGSVSLILIFCVLCLTIFALLTLSSARSENELAKKLASSTQSYYDADFLATETYKELKDSVSRGEKPALVSGLEINYIDSDEETGFYFLVPIDEKRSLAVHAAYSDDEFETLQWLVTGNGNWLPDETLDVLFSDDDEYGAEYEEEGN